MHKASPFGGGWWGLLGMGEAVVLNLKPFDLGHPNPVNK
jgi:hypothetical protein